MIVLASSSPRRKELLKLIISEFKVVPSTIDEETLIPKEMSAMDVPEFLSVKKACDVLINCPEDIIIAADTAIVYNNKMYGKPKNINHAKQMLQTFSNKTHYVVTGVAIVSKKRTVSFSSVNEVTFYNLSDDEIDAYLSIKEYADKAGSYAIQGKGGLFVKSIVGDFNSIIGLPIAEINRLLKKLF